MSIEAVDSLIQAAGKDVALQQKLEAAQGFAEVVQIGTEKGYQFTEEEVQAFLRESGITLEGIQQEELSEEALDAVAGGSIWDGKWTDNVRINIRGW
ncbi:Nif11-like leader peptide family natural product precursor [Brasilonema sp. UFV-L1]|uniref:Nif11-like leader peptide family natural product precursor n=1 Tax=Brasilonema sp. UFV-L1 TaxID=2234130 RepID=UPI00145D7B49|nr:Nif11-like leader peptide family natural product precursor [Brasilonema sp. UFV-L1]NMG07824.1 Nif11-like leader peptide family natural product precursor [Brasilonema sp. UFV-L1]